MIEKIFKNQKACPQCLKHSFCRRGITAIEILVVIAVLGILFSIVLPQFSNMKENQVLKNGVEDIVSAINSAQGESLASKNSGEFGVHFQNNAVIIFSGQVYSAGASDNKIINIISPANISNVTLNSVSDSEGDLYFQRLSGVPSKTGTITISTTSQSKIITISATGAVSVN